MKGIAIAGQTPSEAAFSILMFVMSIAITGTFAYYLVAEPARLTELWEWTRSLNIFVQGILWVLFLPWMIALWIWTLPWALPIRLLLVVATMVWTTWMLYPWKA